MQSPSFKNKVEALELNLKNLEKELINERDKLTSMIEHHEADNRYIVGKNPSIDMNIDTNDKFIEINLSNPVR